MEKILYIAPHDIRKRTGGALATLSYYNALVNLYGDKVDIMMPAEFCDYSIQSVIPAKSRSHIVALLSGSLHRYKNAVKMLLSVSRGKYKLCVINGGLYAGDMMDMIHDFGLRIMVIHHNFEREYAMDNKGLLTLGGHTSYFIVKNEKRAYQKADLNCFLTKEDIALFKKHYGKSPSNVFLLGTFEPADTELPKVYEGFSNRAIAITGSMNSVQTMCGISDIHSNYYDIIKDLCPDWNLVIAGRNPRQEVYDLQKENPDRINVVANPENMEDVTSQASIFLCPTNVGGGLKLRLMDGLRMGLPVLVHKVSARGYDTFWDKPYFKVYDNRDSFKKGLMDLLKYCREDYEPTVIQCDYLMSFGFRAGCARMSEAISILMG